MTTEELAKRLISLINKGENLKAEEELYSDDVISVEQNGYTATGKAAIMAKTKGALEGIEKFFSGGVSRAFVGKDTILLEFNMDIQPKGGERIQMKESGFYRVKDGKIVEEHFYAEPFSVQLS